MIKENLPISEQSEKTDVLLRNEIKAIYPRKFVLTILGGSRKDGCIIEDVSMLKMDALLKLCLVNVFC